MATGSGRIEPSSQPRQGAKSAIVDKLGRRERFQSVLVLLSSCSFDVTIRDPGVFPLDPPESAELHGRAGAAILLNAGSCQSGLSMSIAETVRYSI